MPDAGMTAPLLVVEDLRKYYVTRRRLMGRAPAPIRARPVTRR